MSHMEYRAWITVHGIDVESDEAERLLVALERKHGDLGPVLSGTDTGVDVVLGTDQDDAGLAAREMYDAVIDGLLSIHRPALYPSRVQVEPAGDLVPVA